MTSKKGNEVIIIIIVILVVQLNDWKTKGTYHLRFECLAAKKLDQGQKRKWIGMGRGGEEINTGYLPMKTNWS